MASYVTEPVRVMNLVFASPLGIAAGFDTAGHLGRAASALGFAFNEIGSLDAASLTASPMINQSGEARLGINLRLDPGSSVDAHCRGLAFAWEQADYLMLNLISPGSEVLLQDRTHRYRLLTALLQQRRDLERHGSRRIPMAVKLRSLPGQTPLNIARELRDMGFDGILAAHDPGPPTTRERYMAWQRTQAQEQTCRQIEQLRAACGDHMALMSVGGIQRREHLLARLQAGADLVQLCSALHNRGSALASELLD